MTYDHKQTNHNELDIFVIFDVYLEEQRNWVFATNSDFLIPSSFSTKLQTLDILNYEFC